MELNEVMMNQAACDAALLLTEAIRELTTPQHLMTCVDQLEGTQRVSTDYAAAVRRIVMTTTIIGVY